jgi:hypothetical protein
MLKNINEQLERGELPKEFNYTNIDDMLNIDIEKLKYNAFYRSYEFYEKRFEKELKYIPHFDKVVENIVNEKEQLEITPLKEYEDRFETTEYNIEEELNNIHIEIKDEKIIISDNINNE